MNSDNSCEILFSFDKKEYQQLEEFINSPYHNKSNISKKLLPLLLNKAETKQSVFEKLFPGKIYDDVLFRKHISNFNKLLKDYLSFSAFKKSSFEKSKHLLNELHARKLYKHFEREFKNASAFLYTLKSEPNYFGQLFELETIMVDYLIATEKQRYSFQNVKNQGDYLLIYSLINLLNIAHELITQRDVIDESLSFKLIETYLDNIPFDKILDLLEKDYPQYKEIIMIYYNMYCSIKEPEEIKYLDTLEHLIKSNLHNFNKQEKFNLLVIYEACAVGSFTSDDSKNQKLLSFYKFMLNNGVYSHRERDYMQLNLFRSIFYTAILLKDFEWAQKFASDYIELLSPEYRSNMMNFCLGTICFEKGEFHKSLEHISKTNYDFFIFQYDVKLTLLKIFYELNHFQEAAAHCSSFKMFLKNNKSLSKNYRERFYNFIKFYLKLIKLKEKPNEIDSGVLKSRLNEESMIIAKKWLSSKL